MISTTPFDDLAAEYDTTFTRTAVGSILRELVWARFEALFRSGQRVLDLGCGTGEDAARLAGMGIDVVATDPSARMLDMARAKARSRACAGRIDFHQASMEDVPLLLENARFAGIVSNFGALNCVRDVSVLMRGLAPLCTPGANLLLVVMGRYVPWEWIWYGIRGDARRALRRMQRAGVEWRGLTISYPTPRQLAAHLAPYFAVTRVAPLGCWLPPTYATTWLQQAPRALRVLERLERASHDSRMLASVSDHYVLEATRTVAPGGPSS